MAPPSPSVALVGPTDPRWERALTGTPHDVYQLPGYVSFASRHQVVGEPLALIVERGDDRLLMPLIVRAVPPALGADGRLRDAISPRGYAGPVLGASADDRDAFLREAIEAVTSVLRDQGIVSAFVRLHPLFGLPLPVLAEHGEVVDHGESVSIDLARDEEELWRQMRTNHRRDITAATRSGLVARIDEDWTRFDDFVAAFAQSMERLDAAPWWRLGAEYFAGLREALGDRLRLCVVEDGGQVAAAALLTEVDGIVEYHLSGTFDAYIRASPTKLIIHFATLWAKGRGNRLLHLAGSIGRGDALIRFKLGFSPTAHPVRSWRIVPDESAYAALVAARAQGHEAGVLDGDFFPAYRREA